MRDSGQKNAPRLKKGGVPAGSPAAAVLSWPSLLPLRGLPTAAAGRPATDGARIITIMRLYADGLRLVVAARSAPSLCPAACLPCWLLPDALPCSLLLVAVPVLSLMAAQQHRGREAQSRGATPCIVRIRTK